MGVADSPNQVPFQRVSVSGIHVTGVPLEDLIRAASLLISALGLRQHYMEVSGQSFYKSVAQYLSERGLPQRNIRNKNHYSMIFDKALKQIGTEEAERYLQMTICSSDEALDQPSAHDGYSPQHSFSHSFGEHLVHWFASLCSSRKQVLKNQVFHYAILNLNKITNATARAAPLISSRSHAAATSADIYNKIALTCRVCRGYNTGPSGLEAPDGEETPLVGRCHPPGIPLDALANS
ncbi:hypothetical protein evm_015161 [Chilo suppressalis]|nr:hypothetical protein evm_015161 [Chilo suppressalis]